MVKHEFIACSIFLVKYMLTIYPAIRIDDSETLTRDLKAPLQSLTRSP